jgi:hypothetical protein
MKVEKSGLHINEANEVIGWVNAGDDINMKNGDTIISHHKTAEKKSLLDTFNELKAQNAPAKPEKKEKAEVATRTRIDVPTEGPYTVVKTSMAEGEECERLTIAQALVDSKTFQEFWSRVPEKFNHVGRDGAPKEFATKGFVAYAIRRGMITIG